MTIVRTAAPIALAGLLSACASSPTRAAKPSSSSAPIDPERISSLTRTLSGDEFEGRAPGTPGEAKTIAWIAEAYRAAGLEPAGESGTYLQRVPLIRTQLKAPGAVSVDQGGERIA